MRPSWDEYFGAITKLVATRSTCLRAQHGAVLVNDRRILATGYNGSPPNTIHCSDTNDCIREKLNIPSGTQYEKCRALHAEQNCFMQAAKLGISTEGSTIYITDIPCEICAKLIMSAGVTRIVALKDSQRYSIEALTEFLDLGGELFILEGDLLNGRC